MDRPDQGEIRLEEESVAQASDEIRTSLRNRKIGFVFQFHFLIKRTYGLRERLPFLCAKQVSREKDASDRAAEVLRKLGLGDKCERFANRLSGGEQQRVAIARALVHSPALLLADEPTGNLDSSNSEKVFELLLQFARKERIAVILVTHNSELAEKCDRILRMRDGRFLSD